MNLLKKKYRLWLLGSVILLSFWQVTFLIFSIKFDQIDISLPWRYLISQSLRSGQLPLWNPSIFYGFPQICEPQTWYPISAFLGFVFSYNNLVQHVEIMGHIIFGAIGFYWLLKKLNVSKTMALIFGYLYVTTGFFSGNFQHLGWLISACYLPWIAWSFYNCIYQRNLKFFLVLALALFCLLTGGYPAFFIITCYALAGWFIVFYYKNGTSNLPFKNWLIFIVVFGLLGFGPIYFGFELKENLVRGSGLSVEQMKLGSLTIKSLVSTIFPFVAGSNANFFEVLDFGLTNNYIGLGVVLMAIFALRFKQKHTQNYTVLGVGIFFLLAALAVELPIRTWLYHTLPFFKVFRFPALFRLFFMFCILVWVALNLKNYEVSLNKYINYKKLVYLAFTIGLFITSFLAIWVKWSLLTAFISNPFNSQVITHLPTRFFVDFIVLIIALFVWLLLAKFTSYPKLTQVLLVIGVHAFLYLIILGPAYVYDSNKPFVLAQQLKEVKGINPKFLPEKSMIENFSELPNLNSVWRNEAHFFGFPSPYGYTPYALKNLAEVTIETIQKHFIQKTFVFALNQTDTLSYSQINGQNFLFENNKISFSVDLPDDAQIAIQQNFYPGWAVQVNGKKAPIILVSKTFMGVALPKGKHELSFTFKPKYYKVLFGVSWGLFLFIVFWLLVKGLKIKSLKYK